MIPYELRDTVQVLYAAFSRQPYVPASYWNTTTEFRLDPLYQHTAKQYAADSLFEPQQHEFVLDTTLVHPVGSAPTSRDFQSHAFTRLA